MMKQHFCFPSRNQEGLGAMIFLVGDKRLYKRLCPSVGWLELRKCENAQFRPCPPGRDWYWPCIRPCCKLFDTNGLLLDQTTKLGVSLMQHF